MVYAIASDGKDMEIDTDGTIRDMLANMQEFLDERIGRGFRIDTAGGEPDVTFVQLEVPEEELLLFSELHDPVVSVLWLSSALDDVLVREPEKLYAVFYTFDWEGNFITGQANVGTGVAGTYIRHLSLDRFEDPLWQRIFETTMVHEIFHLLGAVASCAPNNGRGAHVMDHDLDIMSNSGRPQWEWTYVDYGRDDYYGHGRDDCVDIALSPYFEP